jgi:hypothetical protein
MTVLVVIEKAKPFNDAIKILQVHILWGLAAKF